MKKKQDIINLINKYYPNDKNTAFINVRYLWYKWIGCDKLTVENPTIDLIDKKFCKILNSEFEKQDIEDVKNTKEKTLQFLSDKANYYSNVAINIDGYRDEMENEKKILWEKIIEHDKNFVNGYLILLNFYDYKNDCDNFNKYYKLLEDNYIWDEDIKTRIFSRKYRNCSYEK